MASEFKSDLLKVLDERGYIHQCTDPQALDDLASSGTIITAYAGYDCTAPSLHVGHLISILMLRRLQQSGHKPIVLMGGGTTKVGDPTDKDKTRPLLTNDQIAANMDSIKKVFERFLTFGDGPTDAVMVNNAEWLDTLGYVQFLRDYGTHFTINRMLTFDSVKLRLEREQPMTFLEFNYMLMQAYDFHELLGRFECRLQLGGSDQWGNIVNGVELCRRLDRKEVFGLTTPLLATASGAKMGKTEGGAVWLNADLQTPYDYWQFWRNTEDPDVGRFMRLFTDIPLDEIAKYEALEGSEINDAKKRLATDATSMLHGADAARIAEDTARKTFEENTIASSLPTVEIKTNDLRNGLNVVDLFVSAELGKSKGEIKRHIGAGAAKINDTAVSDDKTDVTESFLNADGVIKLSIGKKRHVLIKPV